MVERGLQTCRTIDTRTSKLSNILHAYSALVPPRQISIPPVLAFSEVQCFFLNNILLNEHFNQYPPSQKYQRKFWKWALERLEDLSQNEEENEIDELIYQHYLSLIRLVCEDSLPSDSYMTYYWKPMHDPDESDSYETVTLLESQTIVAASITGLRTWRASLAMAQYLIEHPGLVAHSTILELGSGIGFLGIIVASLQLHFGLTRTRTPTNGVLPPGKPGIFLTDLNSCVLDRSTTYSPDRSSVHPNIQYRLLDWFDAISAQENLKLLLEEAHADIILGADIVFNPALVPPLVATLSTALSQAHIQMALVALTIRNESTFDYFLKETESVLMVENVDCRMADNFIQDQVDAGQEIKILRITKQLQHVIIEHSTT